MTRSSVTGVCAILLGTFSLAATGQAQLPASPVLQSFSSPEARLQALENTYVTNLKGLHAPMLQDYLRQLEMLKARIASSGRRSEISAVEQEIASVRNAMATTGVFPLPALLPENTDAVDASKSTTSTLASGNQPLRPRTAAVLTLKASAAIGRSNAPADAAAPLGQLDWSLTGLAAGSFDVAIVYACPALDKAEHITFTIAGQEQSQRVAVSRATGSEKDFRILRLGTFTLEQPIGASTLSVRASKPDSPFLIRSIIVSNTKPPADGPPDKPQP